MHNDGKEEMLVKFNAQFHATCLNPLVWDAGSSYVRPTVPLRRFQNADDEKSVQANTRPNPVMNMCVRTQVQCKLMSLQFMLVNDATALSALQLEPYVLP